MPEAQHSPLWAWVTLLLSGLIVLGYAVIAFNWFFQSKLSKHEQARSALARLRNISFACALCGFVFFTTDTAWFLWRMYDGILLLLVAYTWSFLLRMRGLSLVDERLAQMDELEQSAAKYREIAELLPHMVWTADADGRVDFSNQRWREYAGNNRSWLESVHPDEQQQAIARWRTASTARVPISLELRLGGAGGYRMFLVKATTISRGNAVRWLGACADIEDQRLLAAQREAQAKQKSFWLNALSHDLRAPLHNVALNAHLLKLSAKDPGDVESVEMIIENAAAAGDLVAKLLDFAKVGAQDNNVMEQVDVAALLHQVARRFQPVVEHRGLRLRVLATEGASVLSDRQKLQRIVSNLVDNAIKYTRHGEVMLELSSRDDREENVVIRVTDTGIGIPPAHAPHLFDEFYQVDNYERDRSKGFGMGLAICKDLARHLGGDVRLAHSSTDGSCFEVVLKRNASGVGADRGGRPVGAPGDQPAAAVAGLCRV
ncbi:MAG TPA: PAS domain-containing sensor histidine kinase [Tepidisphaeraceae bacterium]|nr:PAS domain-containing sensor histidine kinase [Tepidisphaeraceae bacterium]